MFNPWHLACDGIDPQVSSAQATTCPACARRLAKRRFRIRRDSSPEGGCMRTRTKDDDRQFRIALLLLVALLLLASLPG